VRVLERNEEEFYDEEFNRKQLEEELKNDSKKMNFNFYRKQLSLTGLNLS